MAATGKVVAFSEKEKLYLLELIKRFPIVESRKTDVGTIAVKKRAWEEICRIFNSSGNFQKRSLVQLRKHWDNVKTRRKRELGEETRELMSTGGGPYKPHKPSCPEVEVVAPHINYHLGYEWDGDAVAMENAAAKRQRISISDVTAALRSTGSTVAGTTILEYLNTTDSPTTSSASQPLPLLSPDPQASVSLFKSSLSPPSPPFPPPPPSFTPPPPPFPSSSLSPSPPPPSPPPSLSHSLSLSLPSSLPPPPPSLPPPPSSSLLPPPSSSLPPPLLSSSPTLTRPVLLKRTLRAHEEREKVWLEHEQELHRERLAEAKLSHQEAIRRQQRAEELHHLEVKLLESKVRQQEEEAQHQAELRSLALQVAKAKHQAQLQKLLEPVRAATSSVSSPCSPSETSHFPN